MMALKNRLVSGIKFWDGHNGRCSIEFDCEELIELCFVLLLFLLYGN